MTWLLPPPQATRPNVNKSGKVASAVARRTSLVRYCGFVRVVTEKPKTNPIPANTTTNIRREKGGECLSVNMGNAEDLPLVFTLTVKVVARPPVTETVGGTWQVAARGAPEQDSEIVPEKFCAGKI